MAYESLIGNWSDGSQYYDMRKKYMLQRVDDAYNDRNISSKMGNSLVEHQGMVDAEKLRDDNPKTGKAVSLLRDSNTVTDALVDSLEAVAKQDKMKATTGGFASLSVGKKETDAKGLTKVQSLLGRADGTSPNSYTYYEDAVDPETGGKIYDSVWSPTEGFTQKVRQVAQTAFDFSLSAGEKSKLKNSSVQALLDKFFEVDTSKY